MDRKMKRPAPRCLVQLYAALLYNANLKGFIDGHIYTGNLKAVCVPGLNCYSCPGAIAGCPLGSLQNALSTVAHTAPWYVMGILALFGAILGRTVCGWICPLGLIQELLHKIPTPKIRRSHITRKLSYLKYVFLAVFVVAVPVVYGVWKDLALPAFCKYICPAGTLEGAVGLLQNPANSTSFYQLGAVFTNKWVIMLAIGLLCIFCYRTFCRFICPLGAIYGFFNRFALTGIKVNPDRCSGCGLCVTKCEMDVKHIGDHECISCGKCIDTCACGAISLKCGKITLLNKPVSAVRDESIVSSKAHQNRQAPQCETASISIAEPEAEINTDPETAVRKRRNIGRIVWGAALAMLAFALVWFNFISPARNQAQSTAVEPAMEAWMPAEPEPAADLMNLSVGTEIGNLAPDFSTDLLSGETFTLSEHRGQVVIINFWGTTCEPCVAELPYYEQLKISHPDIEILAIHNRAGAKKAAAFLEDKGWDHLDFALDSKEKGILPLLNAADAMPQTIVLNPQGVVTYNAQAPLTYEKLEALYLEALGTPAGA